jgi:hypothetical protein
VRRFAFSAYLLLATFAVHAQTGTLKNGEVLRGRFVQERFLVGFSKPVVSEGSFALLPGFGLIWQAESPFPVMTVITGNGLVQSVDGSEIARLTASRLPFLPRLYDMLSGALTGNFLALENEFSVTSAADGRFMRLRLEPKRADAASALAIVSLDIFIDRFVERVEISKPGGDRDRLIFKNQILHKGEPTNAELRALGAAK